MRKSSLSCKSTNDRFVTAIVNINDAVNEELALVGSLLRAIEMMTATGAEPNKHDVFNLARCAALITETLEGTVDDFSRRVIDMTPSDGVAHG